MPYNIYYQFSFFPFLRQSLLIPIISPLRIRLPLPSSLNSHFLPIFRWCKSYKWQCQSSIQYFNRLIARMSINQVLMSKCSLCSGQKSELRLVFRQLHKKLKIILATTEMAGFSQEGDNCAETEGFAQLLRVMNIAADREVRKWSQCKHLRFFKWLQKSLNCNFTTLNYLCEITANHLAYKNYCIALLEAQFKNIGEKVGCLGLAGPEVVKIEEPMIASMSSLPSEREVEGNCVLLASQTSIEEMGMEYVNNGFNYYCQFPFFYGKPA